MFGYCLIKDEDNYEFLYNKYSKYIRPDNIIFAIKYKNFIICKLKQLLKHKVRFLRIDVDRRYKYKEDIRNKNKFDEIIGIKTPDLELALNKLKKYYAKELTINTNIKNYNKLDINGPCANILNINFPKKVTFSSKKSPIRDDFAFYINNNNFPVTYINGKGFSFSNYHIGFCYSSRYYLWKLIKRTKKLEKLNLTKKIDLKKVKL